MTVWGDHVDVITQRISLLFFPFLFFFSSPLILQRGPCSAACELRVGAHLHPTLLSQTLEGLRQMLPQIPPSLYCRGWDAKKTLLYTGVEKGLRLVQTCIPPSLYCRGWDAKRTLLYTKVEEGSRVVLTLTPPSPYCRGGCEVSADSHPTLPLL